MSRVNWRAELTRDELAELAAIEMERDRARRDVRELSQRFNVLLARGNMRARRP